MRGEGVAAGPARGAAAGEGRARDTAIGARSHHDLVEPGPLPFPEGLPEFAEAWCPGGAPPAGLEFIGCRGTLQCWLLPCPCCCVGWVPVVPIGDADPYGYRLAAAEVGCSAGCDSPEILWWHLWRLGVPPPTSEPADPTRARRYAGACVRRILGDLPERPTLEALRSSAYRIGGWLEAGNIAPDGAAAALLAAASRGGHCNSAHLLAEAMTAGRAQPGRVPA